MILNNHVLVKRGKGENAGKTIPKRKNGKSAEIPAQTPEYECANRANRRHETRTCSPALRPAPPRDTGGVACWSSPRYSPATHYKTLPDESSVQREAPVCPARSWCRWSCASPIAPPAPPGSDRGPPANRAGADSSADDPLPISISSSYQPNAALRRSVFLLWVSVP